MLVTLADAVVIQRKLSAESPLSRCSVDMLGPCSTPNLALKSLVSLYLRYLPSKMCQRCSTVYPGNVGGTQVLSFQHSFPSSRQWPRPRSCPSAPLEVLWGIPDGYPMDPGITVLIFVKSLFSSLSSSWDSQRRCLELPISFCSMVTSRYPGQKMDIVKPWFYWSIRCHQAWLENPSTKWRFIVGNIMYKRLLCQYPLSWANYLHDQVGGQ